MIKRILTIIGLSVLALGLIGLAGYLWIENKINASYGNGPYPIELEIEDGSNLDTIANRLENQGIISSSWIFKLEVKREGFGNKLQAGVFKFGEPLTMPQVIKKLATEGRLPSTRVMIPEGRATKEVTQILSSLRGFDFENYKELSLTGKDKFTFQFTSSIPSQSLEGYLYPETYQLDKVDAESLIKTQLAQFEKVFSKKHIARCKELGLTIHEAVTLASIVERESGRTSEMSKVASVFWNRLNANWKLESCVTVGYALEKPHTILTNQELKTDSPYNTYLYEGLPPGPVCNPGKAAIEATLWPAPSKYFYFVATGRGYNDFSETFREHQIKINKYLKNGLK
jgi:UPF0755 protein